MDESQTVDGITERLVAITQGAQHLVVIARQRVAQMLDALDAGDFRRAIQHLNEAESLLTPLATAQQYIAIADGNRLVRASELEVGMVLTQVGQIESVDKDAQCTGCGNHHILVKVGGIDNELSFHRDQELYVVREP
jgi:hypothetical protein